MDFGGVPRNARKHKRTINAPKIRAARPPTMLPAMMPICLPLNPDDDDPSDDPDDEAPRDVPAPPEELLEDPPPVTFSMIVVALENVMLGVLVVVLEPYTYDVVFEGADEISAHTTVTDSMRAWKRLSLEV